MGAFGIFFAVLTFIYVVYYIAMITMDLSKQNKSKKNGSVEVISANAGLEAKGVQEDEKPTEVDEEDYAIGGAGPEPEEVLTAEEIAAISTDQLYEEFLKSKSGMERICPRAQSEYSLSNQSDLLKQAFLDGMASSANWSGEEV